MTIDPGVFNLINIFFKVVIISAIVSAPAIVLTLAMYSYDRYKKWKDTDVKEKEKIIVGKAKTITKQNEDIKWQQEEIHKLEYKRDVLQIGIDSMNKKLGSSEEPEDTPADAKPIEEIDLTEMNIKQLKAIAKAVGVSMYSKLNKNALLKKLQELPNASIIDIINTLSLDLN